LLAATIYASDVYIEGHGWFIFGGAASQKLFGIDSKWEQGPPVFTTYISGQCAVKVIE